MGAGVQGTGREGEWERGSGCVGTQLGSGHEDVAREMGREGVMVDLSTVDRLQWYYHCVK